MCVIYHTSIADLSPYKAALNHITIYFFKCAKSAWAGKKSK